MTNTHIIGQNAEELAARYLKENGMTIIDRNYSNRFGEIDIVLRDKAVYVIVEVKAKSTSRYGKPFEMVTKRKKRKLVSTGKSYLMERGLDIEKTSWRIDVVSIDYKSGEINWLKNAVSENDLE